MGTLEGIDVFVPGGTIYVCGKHTWVMLNCVPNYRCYECDREESDEEEGPDPGRRS